MATKNTKLTATMPCGTLATRTTARIYTHVVVACDDLASIRAKLAQSNATDRSNYDFRCKQISTGVGGTYMHKATGCRPFEVTVTQGNYDDALQALNGAETFEQYAEAIIAQRLARFDGQHKGADVGAWGVVGWCGRPDLAEKLAAKERNNARNHSVKVIPVNA